MNADGVPSAGSAPVVKLQIVAVKNSQNVEHIVKKTAKGHEVVEVDGFTFIRKRDLPASAVEAPLSKRLQAEPPQFPILAVEQLQAASAKPAASERTASHGSVDQPLSLPACTSPSSGSVHQHSQAAPPCAEAPANPPLPQHLGTESAAPAPLPPDLHQVVTEQLQACFPEGCPTSIALQFAVSRLLELSAARLERQPGPSFASAQTSQDADTGAAAAAAGVAASAPLAAATPALVDALHGTAQRFSQHLADQVSAARTALLQPGSQGLQSFQAMPPVLQQAAQAQGLGPSLAAQLATLQAEAEQWEGLAGRYSSMLAPQPDTTATAVPPDSGEAGVAEQQGGSKPRGSPGSQAAQGGAGSPGVAGAVAGVAAPGGSGLAAAGLMDVTGLGSVRAAVAASMTSQVECLLGLVNKVELMVARAEQVSASMQAEYHADKFATFPHVNSPAWLIKHISQAPLPGGWREDSAAAGGAAGGGPACTPRPGWSLGYGGPPRSPLNL
ncbi:hypothetical protein QJQ45_019917 [Haematococcus lacustris]|nr:hypothetical protein QJQ45_019917 [Haematococcus lacustris]